MYKYLLLIIFAFSNLDSFSQERTMKQKYVQLTDTSFQGFVNWCVYHGLDSALYNHNFPPLIASNSYTSALLNYDSLKPIVFYNFWFITCHPCVDEIPMFNNLARQYTDSIDFIAITFDSQEDVKEFLKTHPFNFLHFTMARSLLNELRIIRGYPTTIITYHNKIIYCKHGGMTSGSKYYEAGMKESEKNYKSILDSLLNIR